MKFKVLVVSVFFVCSLFLGISLAQNKVVVIPLMPDSDNEIQTVTSAGGRVWMDRNLGAYGVAQSVDDYKAYGWLYQWGRLADGHEIHLSHSTSTTSDSNVPGHKLFISPDDPPYDWRIPQNHFMWNSLGGNIFINNPCPPGFRVPTETEWETERATWSSNDSAGAFASPLKLVAAGCRNSRHGTVSNYGFNGFYWTRTVSGSYARFLRFTSDPDSAGIDTYERAYGCSVRCIKN